jgi:hypothetical protein
METMIAKKGKAGRKCLTFAFGSSQYKGKLIAIMMREYRNNSFLGSSRTLILKSLKIITGKITSIQGIRDMAT